MVRRSLPLSLCRLFYPSSRLLSPISHSCKQIIKADQCVQWKEVHVLCAVYVFVVQCCLETFFSWFVRPASILQSRTNSPQTAQWHELVVPKSWLLSLQETNDQRVFVHRDDIEPGIVDSSACNTVDGSLIELCSQRDVVSGKNVAMWFQWGTQRIDPTSESKCAITHISSQSLNPRYGAGTTFGGPGTATLLHFMMQNAPPAHLCCTSAHPITHRYRRCHKPSGIAMRLCRAATH